MGTQYKSICNNIKCIEENKRTVLYIPLIKVLTSSKQIFRIMFHLSPMVITKYL